MAIILTIKFIMIMIRIMIINIFTYCAAILFGNWDQWKRQCLLPFAKGNQPAFLFVPYLRCHCFHSLVFQTNTYWLTDSCSPDLIEWIGGLVFKIMMTLITVVTMTITSNTMHDENFEGWGRLYFFTLVDVGSMAGLENIPTVQRLPHHFLFFHLTKHQFFFPNKPMAYFCIVLSISTSFGNLVTSDDN